jgi:NhaA family Na+:H+ antiporter
VPGSLVGGGSALTKGEPMIERRNRLLSLGSWPETRRVSEVLRKETVGGIILLIAAAAAIIWANTPWAESYFTLRDLKLGGAPFGLHLNLSLGAWAADALLAIFFFVVGLELKREFVLGDLRDPGRAALPIAAAVGGMVVPALIFVAVASQGGEGALKGWAIPTATDIAFAVAVLAVISTHLPAALRMFLLTLAVVDDLLAITVIALFYSDNIKFVALLGALVPLILFTVCVQRGISAWWVLIPLAAMTWVLVHESGVHATVAGVLLGFAVPAARSEHFEHRTRPISAGIAIPVFAFFAAGVSLGGFSGLATALRDPITLGIVLGLVLGKPIGIFLTTWTLSTVSRAELDSSLRWVDVVGVSMLAGIGFTVSLLIGDLAYGLGSERDEFVKVGVLVGSLLAALLASVVLATRNAAYRRIEREETLDTDQDGVPDIYQARQD